MTRMPCYCAVVCTAALQLLYRDAMYTGAHSALVWRTVETIDSPHFASEELSGPFPAYDAPRSTVPTVPSTGALHPSERKDLRHWEHSIHEQRSSACQTQTM
jgi:hypothetical protein